MNSKKILTYYTDDMLKVLVGDIIELPNRKMEYNGKDIVEIMSINIVPEGYIMDLSDGYAITNCGDIFWKVKLVARKIL